jgi:hypothetical protein
VVPAWSGRLVARALSYVGSTYCESLVDRGRSLDVGLKALRRYWGRLRRVEESRRALGVESERTAESGSWAYALDARAAKSLAHGSSKNESAKRRTGREVSQVEMNEQETEEATVRTSDVALLLVSEALTMPSTVRGSAIRTLTL